MFINIKGKLINLDRVDFVTFNEDTGTLYIHGIMNHFGESNRPHVISGDSARAAYEWLCKSCVESFGVEDGELCQYCGIKPVKFRHQDSGLRACENCIDFHEGWHYIDIDTGMALSDAE